MVITQGFVSKARLASCVGLGQCRHVVYWSWRYIKSEITAWVFFFDVEDLDDQSLLDCKFIPQLWWIHTNWALKSRDKYGLLCLWWTSRMWWSVHQTCLSIFECKILPGTAVHHLGLHGFVSEHSRAGLNTEETLTCRCCRWQRQGPYKNFWIVQDNDSSNSSFQSDYWGAKSQLPQCRPSLRIPLEEVLTQSPVSSTPCMACPASAPKPAKSRKAGLQHHIRLMLRARVLWRLHLKQRARLARTRGSSTFAGWCVQAYSRFLGILSAAEVLQRYGRFPMKWSFTSHEWSHVELCCSDLNTVEKVCSACSA